jgi:hypothetical protein
MNAPLYAPVTGGSRLYAGNAAPAGTFAGYWCGATANFGASATLAQTWADVGGFYIFTRVLPADLVVFAGQLAQLAPGISPTGQTKVLWVANDPGISWSFWPTSIVTALPQGASGGPWALVRAAELTLGEYRVRLAAGSAVTLQNDAAGYGLSLPPGGGSFSHGAFSLTASDPIFLALAGQAAGSVAMPLKLTRQQPDPFDRLGVMLRYATTPDPDDAEAVSQNLARYLSMPVLRLRSSGLSARLYFDPNALEPDRTWVDLAPAGSPTTALSSAFMTTLGYATALTPRTGLGAARSGRLAFCKSPIFAVEEENRGFEVFHLAPDGCFTVGVQEPASVQWMFGHSGAEYATFESSSGTVLVCGAGGAAYIRDDPPDGTSPLRPAATTAYLTLVPGTDSLRGLPYYAQPLQAPLYVAGSDPGADFLEFHPMLSGSLPRAQAANLPPHLFPAGAYRWLPPADIELARTMEAAVLAPARRAVIGGNNPAQSSAGLGTEAAPRLAATPQGLLAQLSADGSEWAGVLFGSLPGSNQTLIFTPVRERFAQALQSNQLFFVVTDGEEFLRQSGAGSGGLNCTLDGWTFRLNPSEWRKGQANPTLMLFKYCNRTLVELAGDTSAWGWPQAAGNVAQTQRQLQALLAEARDHFQADPPVPDDPYAIFYSEVANNPAWNGVLFFNAAVDLGLMPPDLEFLAAGIDPKKFYAHHVGFSVTPVSASGGTIKPGQTAAFGLIDYQDAQDLAPSSTVPFGFKTLRLEIRFANARMAGFSAQCELMVNVLFGAPLAKLDPSRGNNIAMNGSCQRVDGVPSYSFVLEGENLFSAQGSAIVSVQLLSVRIDTATAAGGDSVASTFTLQGNLRFIKLAALDMFSFGAGNAEEDGFLRFTGLSIRMQFRLSAPMEQTFMSFEGATSLDPASSVPRKRSLAANFPLQAAGIAVAPAEGDGTGLTPEQMGFVSIACPLDQTPMTAPWYGLLFTIDLGSLGALSGSIGLSMTVLTAWSPGAGELLPVYLGLKLASFVPGGGSLPLQGVLKLGFRSFELIAYQTGEDRMGYQLWMRRFALSVLVWSFPPGNADLVLFGKPDNPSGSLGWYAAYDAKPDGKTPASLPKAAALNGLARRLASGRRTPPVA